MKDRSPYTTAHKIGSLLLMVALLWLSVSLPFVYRFQQQQKVAKSSVSIEKTDSEEDGGNPLTNTNEEKVESGVKMPQEYLHEMLQLQHPVVIVAQQYHSYAQDAFVAWHPEFITPPPDADLL